MSALIGFVAGVAAASAGWLGFAIYYDAKLREREKQARRDFYAEALKRTDQITY